MRKALTVELVREIAMKKYNRGGDRIVECWDDSDILNWISGEDDRAFHGMFGDETAPFTPKIKCLEDLNKLLKKYHTMYDNLE